MNRSTKVLFYLLTYFLFAQTIQADTISFTPFAWYKAGVQTDIPQFNSVINFIQVGGKADGITDQSTLLNHLIRQVEPGTCIFFPKGTYLFKQKILIDRDSLILRGEGPATQFIFEQTTSTPLIHIKGIKESVSYLLNEQVHLQQTYLISKEANHFNPGDWIYLHDIDTGLVNNSWAENKTGQILSIQHLSGDTLYLNEEVRRVYPFNQEPQITKLFPVKFVGIEEISIVREDNSSAQVPHILFENGVNCWVLGIESYLSIFAHISIESSTHVSIKNNYLHHAFEYGGGGKGYGIVLQFGTGDCLIENNIFKHLRHSILLQAGANGNVVSYNFSTEPYWDEPGLPSNSAGDMVLHGNYPYSNLFEGNFLQNLVIDESHGMNGPHNTFFRNAIQGYGFFMIDTLVNFTQIIGNDITQTDFPFGNFIVNERTNYVQANRVKSNFSTDSLVTLSLYLCQKPLWWNALNWPDIGIPFEFAEASIPAKKRFDENQYLFYTPEKIKPQNPYTLHTWYEDQDGDGYGNPEKTISACIQPEKYVQDHSDCNDENANIHPNAIEIPQDGIDQNCDGSDLIVSVLKSSENAAINLYPNPNTGHFNLSISQIPKGHYNLIISDVTGRIITRNELFVTSSYTSIPLTIEQSGSYFIQLKDSDLSLQNQVYILKP